MTGAQDPTLPAGIDWLTFGPTAGFCLALLVIVLRWLDSQRKAAAEEQARREAAAKIERDAFLVALQSQRSEFRETLKEIHEDCHEAIERMRQTAERLAEKLVR